MIEFDLLMKLKQLKNVYIRFQWDQSAIFVYTQYFKTVSVNTGVIWPEDSSWSICSRPCYFTINELRDNY